MVRSLYVRQGYRAYAVGLLILATWTALETMGVVDVSATALGYGWYAIAGLGVLVLVGLSTARSRTFVTESRVNRVERFENGPMGTVTYAYAGVLFVWAAVSMAWWASGRAILDATAIGYGWYAIAGLGAVVTIGLTVRHTAALRDAVSLSGSGVSEDR